MPAKQPTILIADDDPQFLRLVMRTLQMEGYEVLSASDGQNERHWQSILDNPARLQER